MSQPKYLQNERLRVLFLCVFEGTPGLAELPSILSMDHSHPACSWWKLHYIKIVFVAQSGRQGAEC